MKLLLSRNRRRSDSRSYVHNAIDREIDRADAIEPCAAPFNLMTVGTICRDERVAVVFDQNFPGEVSHHRHVASNQVIGIVIDHDIMRMGQTIRSAAFPMLCSIVRNSPVSACQDVSLERIPTEPAHQASTPPQTLRRGDPRGLATAVVARLGAESGRERESTRNIFVASAMSACGESADASTFAR